MKFIKLNTGNISLVDDEDYEYLIQWKWSENSFGYAFRSQRTYLNGACKKVSVFMHKEVLKVPKGKMGDHINGNTLDNRKTNLRVADKYQNAQNRRKSALKSSVYKGVSWMQANNKWLASIKVNGKSHHIGLFDNQQHAATAYDLWAIFFFKDFANTNFKSV